MIGPEFNPMGSCGTGYLGIICAECNTGFSVASTFTCAPCPEKTQNIIRLGAIGIAAVCLMIFLVYSTLKGASQKRSLSSVY